MTMTATRPQTATGGGGSGLRDYIDQNNALPDDVLLGYIAYYSVADGRYDGFHMEAEFDRLGLNKAFLPKRLKPDAAYEKASKVAHGFKYEVDGGLTAELLVRELPRTDETIVRWLVREVKDAEGHRLLWGEVAEMVFYKPPTRNGIVDYSGATTRWSVLPDVSDSERAVLVPQLEAFATAYDRYCRYYDGQALRGIVRNYALSLNAIQMKPSLYFIHRDKADEAQRLQQFVRGLQVDGTSLSLLPLPDLPAMREEVTDAFQRESAEDFQKVLGEIAKVTESRVNGVTMEAYGKLRKQFDDALTKATEHSRTFQVSQAVTAAASEIALNALNALEEEVFKAAMGTS